MSNIMRPVSFVPIFGDLEKEFDRMLHAGFDVAVSEGEWQPKVDIIEEDDKFIAKIDIPGVDPKDININLDNNTLIIKGEKETEHKEKKESFIRYERSKGSFYRRIVLPGTINSDKVSAKNKNGVLIITIPKAEKGKSRKIEIQS